MLYNSDFVTLYLLQYICFFALHRCLNRRQKQMLTDKVKHAKTSNLIHLIQCIFVSVKEAKTFQSKHKIASSIYCHLPVVTWPAITAI